MELAAARPYWLGQNVVLIGDSALSSRYAAALLAQGVQAPCHDVDDMTLRGLRRAYSALKES
jgi:2-dehydro-3-deoxygalactonokinase